MEPIKTISLKQEITVGNEIYRELNLWEPIVNELIVSYKNAGEKGTTVCAYDAQILLVSSISGIPINALEAFPTRILDEAIEYLTTFQTQNDDEIRDDQWEMPLTSPLQLSDGSQISSLDLKEPTVKQRKEAMKKIDAHGQGIVGGLEFQASLLTQVTEQKLPTILKLPISDFTKATNYLMRFFPDIQKVGKDLLTN